MKRNNFNLAHYKAGTCPFGRLVPISCFEALPGDTIQMNTSLFFRLSPMVNPSFSILKAKWWHFFVPFRLLFKQWEDYRTGGPDGLDTTTLPTMKYPGGVYAGTLSDYLGVPVGFDDEHSIFPYRAYWKIFDEFFRDQDLTQPHQGDVDDDQSIVINDSSAVNYHGHQLLHYAWEKDYFTTARPWPQKGAEVSVPVNGISGSQTITISGNGNNAPTFKGTAPSGYPNPSFLNTTSVSSRSANDYDGDQTSNIRLMQNFMDENDVNSRYGQLTWDNPQLTGTLSNSSQGIGSVRLDDLREAFALQRFEEARAMYGSRYTEYLRYLGVKSSDARLQRPEFLGGGRATMQISEVLQTGEDGNSPVGTLRGHGVGAGRSKKFRRFIEEDGLIMTIMSIMPVTLYAQGLPKMFSRKVKEDFWTKELQHIGQQEVMTRELYASADADDVFGFQNRYDEYRSVQSSVCGQMRPGSVDEDWTMARIFNNQPVLNSDFVYGEPSLRNFAEQNYDPVYFLASNSVVAKRLMSKTGNPIM